MGKLLEDFANARGSAKLDILHTIAKQGGGLRWIRKAMPDAAPLELVCWLETNEYRV